MESPIDSSIRGSATGGALLPFDFAECGGYSRRETQEVCPAVGYVCDDHRAFLAPEYLPVSAPQAPEAIPGSSRLDKLYEPHFRRLDAGLELLKAQQLVAELPNALEGNVSAQIHVPSSVTQGYVPALGVLDMKAEGGLELLQLLVAKLSKGALLPLDFAECGGYSRREIEEFCPAVGYMCDDYWAFLAPEYLPVSAPQAPEAIPGSSRLDKLYEPHFRRLDAGLELLKAQQLVAELPNALEGNVSAQIHVPSSVTQGYVPALGVLDMKAESGVVFGSVLVERKAGEKK